MNQIYLFGYVTWHVCQRTFANTAPAFLHYSQSEYLNICTLEAIQRCAQVVSAFKRLKKDTGSISTWGSPDCPESSSGLRLNIGNWHNAQEWVWCLKQATASVCEGGWRLDNYSCFWDNLIESFENYMENVIKCYYMTSVLINSIIF